MRILIVEDEPTLGRQLKSTLEGNGYAVDLSVDGEDGHFMGSTEEYDAVVLDLGLPEIDGLTVLNMWRKEGRKFPVLVLTARDSWSDKVAGLDAGADDYLAKPFATAELAARLQALLRRPGELLGNQLEVGDLSLDVAGRQVSVAGAPQQFSAREIELLELLMRRPGRVIPKTYVEDQLFGLEQPIGSNAVEVSIHRLRRRLQDLSAGVTVHTVRGVGYLISPTPK